MSNPKLYPVFSVDPNGPWHHDEESGETWLVVSVDDFSLTADFINGYIALGDTVILFQPNETPQQSLSETGWASLGVVKQWIQPSSHGRDLVYVAQLEG